MVRIAFFAALALAALACSDSATNPLTELPLPTAVTAADVPAPGDGVFFYIGPGAQKRPEAALLEALNRGVVVDAAWVPQYETPCAAPTAAAAMVVQASDRTGPLLDLGFLSDPEPWLPNCGIDDFWKYDFRTRVKGQEYLFEVGYTNYAWGRAITGSYVDRTGAVYTYDHSETDWHPKDPDAVTGAELQEKFRYRRLVHRVDRETLAGMAALIEPASHGAMSQPTSVCADYGSMAYWGYLYDSRADVYRPVDLYVAGDWAEKNLSKDAKTLYTWLFTLTGGPPNDCLP